jgi:hypothetical protein
MPKKPIDARETRDKRSDTLMVEIVLVLARLIGAHDARALSLKSIYVHTATGAIALDEYGAQSPVTVLVRECERTLPPIS